MFIILSYKKFFLLNTLLRFLLRWQFCSSIKIGNFCLIDIYRPPIISKVLNEIFSKGTSNFNFNVILCGYVNVSTLASDKAFNILNDILESFELQCHVISSTRIYISLDYVVNSRGIMINVSNFDIGISDHYYQLCKFRIHPKKMANISATNKLYSVRYLSNSSNNLDSYEGYFYNYVDFNNFLNSFEVSFSINV